MAVELNLADLTASDGFIIMGDAPSDLAGMSVVCVGDVNGDGFDDLAVGAPTNDAAGTDAGVAYLIFGKSDGFQNIDLGGLATSTGIKITGENADDRAGYNLSAAGDVNGDGIDDILIGVPNNDAGGDGAGSAYVIFGNDGGLADIHLGSLGDGGFKIIGEAAGDIAGCSVASAGDINGDGFDDIIIGARHNDAGGGEAGAAYVIFGKADGFGDINLGSLGTSGFKIQGNNAADQAGWSVSTAGDLNGDGFDDLMVGSPNVFTSAVDVIFGKESGFTNIDLSTLGTAEGFRISSDQYSDVGFGMCSAGDFNGDGIDDIAIGISSTELGACIVYGKQGAFGNLNVLSLPSSAGFRVLGAFVSALANAGDVNGDGFDDILLGANDGAAGGAYVVYGRAGGLSGIDLRTLTDTDGFKIIGASSFDFAGCSVSAAGDVNHDGFADIMIGAYGSNAGGTSAGAAYVLYGQAPTLSVTRAGSEIDQTIRGGAFGDTLDGRGGDDALFGSGGGDTLIGGTGNDKLNGGSGGDTMIGNAGDDIYVADNVNDIIVERSGEGADTVQASVSWRLGANVENLTLTRSAAINGAGNNADNILTGNSGANVLNGTGGADTMKGGNGDDTYAVDNAGDHVVEASASGGTDKVAASVSFTLGANVENLTLTGGAAIDGKGNGLANSINGNGGANVLRGLDGDDTLNGNAGNDQLFGGLGTDKLTGGTGADKFVFDSALGGTNHDNISDFSVADDTIVLDRTIFSAFAANGMLASSAFFTGSAAHDADDRIIYNSGNGNIYYDADGNGAGAQVLIAHVAAGLALTNADFLLVS